MTYYASIITNTRRTLELALKHNAIVVSPDYRLMPESQFSDIIDDLRDFWHWVEHDFKELSGLRVDLSNLAIVGESAGGYLAAQSVLLGLSSQVAIVMLQYPALAIQSLLDSVAQGESDCNAQKVAVSVLDEYLAKVDPSTLLTRALFGSRMDIALASIKSGRLVDLTRYPHFDPMTSLETAGKVPPIFLFHGLDDTSVAASASKAWVEKLKTTHPDVPVYTSFIPGEHVLDHDHTLGEPWLEEPITFVEQYWPVR